MTPSFQASSSDTEQRFVSRSRVDKGEREEPSNFKRFPLIGTDGVEILVLVTFKHEVFLELPFVIARYRPMLGHSVAGLSYLRFRAQKWKSFWKSCQESVKLHSFGRPRRGTVL